MEGTCDSVINKISIIASVDHDPQTYKEAMASRDAAIWRETINDEVNLSILNNTCGLVVLPPGSKATGYKWVFRRKYSSGGTIQTFKARLVAKGLK